MTNHTFAIADNISPISTLSFNPRKVSSVTELRQVLGQAETDSGRKLGDYLMAGGVVTAREIGDAARLAKISHRRIGEQLVAQGCCNRLDVTIALCMQMGVAFIDFESFPIDAKIYRRFSARFAIRYRAIPLAMIDDEIVIVVDNPTHPELQRVFAAVNEGRVRFVTATRQQIEQKIADIYNTFDDDEALKQLEVSMREFDRIKGNPELSGATDKILGSPVVKVLGSILQSGILMQASDINLRPTSSELQVHYRLHGKLTHMKTIPIKALDLIANRVRALANMRSPKRNQTEDGRASFRVGKNDYNLRISIMPTVHGPNIAFRILNGSNEVPLLRQMGYSDAINKTIEESLDRRGGIVLVTGSTGQGKSSLLRTMLQMLRKGEPNILTLEDPVECIMDGITQVEINEANGLTFAKGLRQALRHDPDIIMVGEIRDEETAKMAVRAAMTGHMVLSTLHTSSASASIGRLLDLGVEQRELATTLNAIVSQRLVPANCEMCIDIDEIPTAYRNLEKPDQPFMRSKGCEHCNQSGISGRLPVAEMLLATKRLREAIALGADTVSITALAEKEGMISLHDNALTLAYEGLTPFSEILPVLLQSRKQGEWQKSPVRLVV